MSYDVGFCIMFVVLFVTYFFIMREEDGSIRIFNLAACFGISLMLASAWPLVLWMCGIAACIGFAVGAGEFLYEHASPVISRLGNVRLKVF